MIINASNGDIINSNEVCIHDNILDLLTFIRAEKKIHLSILKNTELADTKFSIDFFNVIGFEMSSCDFWGYSPHILDFEYLKQEQNTLIPKFFEMKKSNNYQFCTLKEQEKYFEILFTFSSGDTLLIACETMIIT